LSLDVLRPHRGPRKRLHEFAIEGGELDSLALRQLDKQCVVKRDEVSSLNWAVQVEQENE